MMKNVLLIEPAFPYPRKSRHRANEIHKNFVPIGLLKIGAYYRSKGHNVRLVRGNHELSSFDSFNPSLIFITSLFTYWSKYVWETVSHYRRLFPNSIITIGGIYVTLHHEMKYFKDKLKEYNALCHVGVYEKAERYYPDYTLLDSVIKYHATHAMRGCIRKCSFCGTWKIEPIRYDKNPEDLIKELKDVGKNKVVFFDNNFLANQYIHEILDRLAKLRINGKPVAYECQSGFDGRLLEDSPELAALLKKAKFQNIKIAWDNSVEDYPLIEKQLDLLIRAGFKAKNISIFMIYNFNIPYKDMQKKLEFCRKWGVQITDCRFRPLDSVDDNYNSRKAPLNPDKVGYYLHPGWNDTLIRAFRKNVREHNIWVRYARDKGRIYNARMERWGTFKRVFKYFRLREQPKLHDFDKLSPWWSRFDAMSKIRTYFLKHNIAQPDFSELTIEQIDSELKTIMNEINCQVTSLPKNMDQDFSDEFTSVNTGLSS